MNGVLKKIYEFVGELFDSNKEESINYKKVIEEFKIIKRAIQPEHDIRNEDEFHVWKTLNMVSFDSKNMNLDKDTKLKTLVKKYQYDTLGHSSYQLDYDEYEKIYLNETNNKIERIVSSIIDLVNRYQDDMQIIYLLNSYAITIFTVSNTIKESIELNGEVSNEIKDDVITILNGFLTAINNREQQIKQDLQSDLDAVNQSLSDRLKSELQYVETYLK